MSNILEMTDIAEKLKRIERISGRLASKVRLTPATALSLKKNIDSGNITKGIDKYNDIYMELRNAVVSAEVAAAEQEARDSALKDPNAAKEEELRNARIAEDNLIAKITSVDVTKPRLEALKLSVEMLSGRFGTLGDHFGVNVKSGYAPKALSVPSIYSKVYRVVFKNGDLYKLAYKIGLKEMGVAEQQTVSETPPTKVANWRGLFNDIKADKQEINVAMDAIPDPESEENFVAPVISKNITAEELSHRRMLGQIGDEIQEVRRLQKSSNGLSSPFSAGLFEREDSLLNMLSNISGVEEIAKRKVKPTQTHNNTEFQNLIDQIVGYREPVSEEEHKQEEMKMQEYYSNPEVSQIIDELRHKDMLYAFNQPEVYNKIMESERVDNERKASQSVAVDVLDFNEETEQASEIDNEVIPITKEAINVNPAVDAMQEKPTEEVALNDVEEEKQALIEGAYEQARLLQKQNEYADIIIGAEEQARILQEQNERLELLEGAEEQARMLKTLYDFMDKQEELERKAQEEQAALLAGAEEQARMLISQNEEEDTSSGAEEQARMLLAQNEKADIINGAEEQAQMLQAQNEKADLTNGAEEQAKMLLAQNERADLANGAEEQAKLLISQIEEDTSSGAEEQAKMLLAQNERADLANGAEEQAKLLISQIEEDTSSGAEEQARMLLAQNERADLANGAEEQAKLLISQIEEDTSSGAEEQARMLLAQNERADLANGAEEQAKLLIAQNEEEDTSSGAEEQARLLLAQNERADLANGAEEQAQMLLDQNKKAAELNGAEEQARMLLAQNERVDLANGAEEQAQLLIIHNNEIEVLNDAEEQAKMLLAQNERADLANGAEEQAQMLQAQNERADITNGAEEQARILLDYNRKADIINAQEEEFRVLKAKSERTDLIIGAYEQALMLQRQISPPFNQSGVMSTQTNNGMPNADGHNNTITIQDEELKKAAEDQARKIYEANVRADLINGAEEQARIIIEQSKKSPSKPISGKNYELVDKNDRYGNIISASKPIKLGKKQMNNLLLKVKKNTNSDYSKKREALTAIKEQLEAPNFDFLKYNGETA